MDRIIDGHLQWIAEVARPYACSGVLIGGYGRGEGTPFIRSDGSQGPFNDYDLVVVVDEIDHSVRRKFREMEEQLSIELGLPVDLCPYRRTDLPACEFSLLNYEMKQGHKVIWGDENILDAMPEYSSDAIPLSEGSRLLLNRGKLLLDIKMRITQPEPLSEEEQIRFLKFIYKVWLAFGDAALLAERKYDVLYAVKNKHIDSIGEWPDRETVIRRYSDAIELKHWGDYHARLTDTDLTAEYRQVKAVFLRFFARYRKQHAQRECSPIKAILLNLKWNGRPLPRHPREYLYDALQELLQDEPNEYRLREMMFCRENATERFYALRARFA